MNKNLGKLWEMVRDREAWHVTVYRATKSRTRQLNGSNMALKGLPRWH